MSVASARGRVGPDGRVSDRDRARAAAQLRRAAADGYLTADTLERRLAAASRSKRRSDLAEVMNDLPSHFWRFRLWPPVRSTVSAPPLSTPAVLTPPPDMSRGPFVIGRGRSSDLWIDDPAVSEHHADLTLSDEGWLLRDVGSRNGTRVNGWRIDQAPLVDGDFVQFAQVGLVFRDRQHEPRPRRTPRDEG